MKLKSSGHFIVDNMFIILKVEKKNENEILDQSQHVRFSHPLLML
jgi:hypothetical protein